MNVAKWLLLAFLALPLAELAVFIAVASSIGFAWALILLLGTSLAGGLVLRHASGSHIARVRVALNQGSFTALQADSCGALILLAGILLLIPGFITDTVGLMLLFTSLFRRGFPPPQPNGVVDLEPEQWRHVPDPMLPNRPEDEQKP